MVANQKYTVAVRTLGSATYTQIATVDYTPFSGVSAGSYDTKVTITENATGVLASGVDSIRFTFTDPGGSNVLGTLVREGVATTASTSKQPSATLLGVGGISLVIRLHR